MKSHYCILIIFFLLTGCASSDNWARGRSTASERRALKQELANDEKLCKEQALKEATNGSILGKVDPADDSIDARATRMVLFNNCMQKKGYNNYGDVGTLPIDVHIVK